MAIPRAEMLTALTPSNLPEGLVLDGQGNAYLSMVLTGEIRKIAPDGTQSKLAQVPTMVAGLTVGPSNELYAAVAPQPADPCKHGIWRIQPDGTASLFAMLPPDSFPNDVVLDAQGRLFAVNCATISANVPGANPKPSLMKIDVGVPGLLLP